MSDNFNNRLRRTTKTITFTGAAGLGAQGTVAAGTVTGAVLIEYLACRCLTNLAGATATVELGVAGNTASLIAQTTATDIDDGDWWHDATPEVGVSTPVINKTVELDIILTVATADVTAGALEITYYWRPTSANGNLA